MVTGRRWLSLGSVIMLVIVLGVARAEAIEYRLRTVSIYEQGLYAFTSSRELHDDATGPGLERLQASLESGQFPTGSLLYDRPLQLVVDGRVQSFAAVPARAEISRAGIGGQVWEEARWEGKPGERTVWIISAGNTRVQELQRLVLKGTGPLRQFQPRIGPLDGKKLLAVSMPLNFVWAEQERGVLWTKWLSKSLKLHEGLAALVGVNDDPLITDVVYLIVEQADKPTMYEAVLAWRRRTHTDRGNIEAPGAIENRR
jgi:hypothetical protein